jgi:outer membrane receptor protein involved in Fe transport
MASTAALMAAFAPGMIGVARAQETENVTVSASRIIRDGFQAPTPTTVLGADDIQAQAQENIVASVSQLPSLLGSQSVNTGTGGTGGGTNGLSTFAMRGLGTIRTLTLIDGQRIVPSNVTGVSDVSELPQLLIQRVDVVTGGASASWGSDAISGVVNVILDKKFTGFKASLQSGITTYGDDASVLMQMAAGTEFAGGRGHIEGSVEYNWEDGVGVGDYGVGRGPSGRPYFTSTAILKNTIAGTPAGTPQYTVAANAQPFLQGRYGIITTGPLQGTAFGDNGAPFQFNYGVGPNGLQGVPSKSLTSGAVTNCFSPWCIGGDTSGAFGGGITDISPITRLDVFTRVSFDLTPKMNIWATVNYGDVHTENRSVRNIPIFGGLNIQCGNAAGGGNAFLPASINQACINNNITTFQIGTDNGAIDDGATIKTARVMRRFVVGADGSFGLLGTDWTFNSYYEHGEVDSKIRVHTFLNPYFNAAVDSVAGPNGTIVCRNTVARSIGCVPYNIFGNVKVSQATIDWLFGGTHNAGTQQLTHLNEDALSISANGEPFSTWAGPVSIATGFEYRDERYDVTGDPVSTGGAGCTDPLLNCTGGGNWFNGNFFSGSGAYQVTEGFMETLVPLLKSDQLGEINLSLAGRATSYSTSGYVNTWKAGVTWETPITGLRFRALQSRDIRAPNLSELFAAQTVVTSTVQNTFLSPPVPFQIQNISRGNTALKPEKAQTTEVGVVYQPDWFPGFNTSVDYYRISLRGQIGSFSAQQSMDLCSNGFTANCAAIITTPPGGDLHLASTVISQVIATAFNLQTTVTDGFDFEASYRFGLENWGIPGQFTLRTLATHVSKFISTSGVLGTVPHESAGENGGSIPHWKFFGLQSYNNDKWGINFSETWISDGRLNTQYIQCTSGCPLPTVNNPTVNNNFLPGAFYFSVGGTYNINENWQLFGKIDNVTNVDPPSVAAAAANSNAINPLLYDTAGRLYRLGVRLNL